MNISKILSLVWCEIRDCCAINKQAFGPYNDNEYHLVTDDTLDLSADQFHSVTLMVEGGGATVIVGGNPATPLIDGSVNTWTASTFLSNQILVVVDAQTTVAVLTVK